MLKINKSRLKERLIFPSLALLFCLLSGCGNKTPQTGTITPSSGTSFINQPIALTATYTDADGWQNIKSAYLLINTLVDTAGCFYAYYDRNSNKFYLRNDANAAWLGGYLPGSSNIIENSYATLDCSKAAASGSGSGNILTVKWSITFKAASAGAEKAYLCVKDTANASSGWAQKGTWNIDASNNPPLINSILPENNSTFLAGAKIIIKANASDSDNDPLQYQFSIGGTVKQIWSASDTYIWQTRASDTGAVSITCQVRDNKYSQTSKTISYSIINPAIKDILKKAVDNYAKIYDMKADMVLSSTLNGQPFGETEYCKYYFKAPDKEKTETFSNSNRTVKTDMIIINGSTMHLIDPVNNIKQQVDLLTDAGITSVQFNQMDIYYNQANFLNSHTVTRNDADTYFSNIIVAIDAVPKNLNNIYDKLGILIDYRKGIITRYSIYKKNELNKLELVQEIKVIESLRMPNGAWIPSKMIKIPNLTKANFVSTLVYNNLWINSGLRDIDFDPNKQ